MNISDLKKLCDEATPGPWRLTETVNPDREALDNGYSIEAPDGEILFDDTKYYPSSSDRVEDARFIAAARTYLPKLLAVAEAAKVATAGWSCAKPWPDVLEALAALEAD